LVKSDKGNATIMTHEQITLNNLVTNQTVGLDMADNRELQIVVMICIGYAVLLGYFLATKLLK